MSFRPNTTASLLRKAGRNIHGRQSYSAPVPLPCAVVSLDERVVQTSVRADSTASRGAAEEEVLQAVILIPAKTEIAEGDVIKILGRNIEVEGIEPRLDIFGQLDHQQIRGNIKGNL